LSDEHAVSRPPQPGVRLNTPKFGRHLTLAVVLQPSPGLIHLEFIGNCRRILQGILFEFQEL
jgi:hypothetical protein